MLQRLFRVMIALLLAGPSMAKEPTAAWEAQYTSSADDTKQKSMFYAPQHGKPVPMIVALHSWSADYKQTSQQAIEQWCIDNGWAYLHPNFRGPNNRPEATGSDLVVADILSAIDYAKGQVNIDDKAIYLVGASGGGYTALLLAGRHPEVWAGVSAWVPISDLTAWHQHCAKKGLKYARDIEKSCGGKPGDSDKIDHEYRHRSPITHLPGAKCEVDLHINAGIHDGHKGSVPISHSLRAFNAVAQPQDRLSDEQIDQFVTSAKLPDGLESAEKDESYAKKQPLFSRKSGRASVTIFDGGHEIVHTAALAWVDTHRRTRSRKQEARQLPEVIPDCCSL